MVWEFQFITFLQQNGNAFFDFLWSVVSMFGEELIMVGVIGALYWCFNKEFAEYMGYSLLTSTVVNGLIKNVVTRDRPFQSDDWQIENKKPDTAGGYSFPSGHSQGSATLFSSLAIWLKRRWMTVIAIIVPLLVAFSRLYLGVHFPTDVIAGLALGVGFSFLCYYLHKKVKDKYLLYIVTLLICSVGLFFCKTDDYFSTFGLMLGAFFGFLFESRFVNFGYDIIWWKKLIRFAGGIAVILILKEGLKLLFNLIVPGSLYLTLIRYAVMAFCGIGLYPMLFARLKF